jgi:beta-lactamase family protein
MSLISDYRPAVSEGSRKSPAFSFLRSSLRTSGPTVELATGSPSLPTFTPGPRFASPSNTRGQNRIKKKITVQHLLDMASGIAWVQRVHTSDESLPQMYASQDPTGQPMSDPPGEKFSYKGGAPHLLSALINKLSGQNALEFAKAESFASLGITDVRWRPSTSKASSSGVQCRRPLHFGGDRLVPILGPQAHNRKSFFVSCTMPEISISKSAIRSPLTSPLTTVMSLAVPTRSNV